MRKLCCICEAAFESGTAQKTCSDECADVRSSQGQSPHSRYAIVLRLLDAENAPADDALRSENFYFEIIAGPCTYCAGPLGKSGHCLDRIIDRLGHRGFNVCSACPTCNRLKSGPGKYRDGGFTFEEMRIIGRAVRAVRRQRSQQQQSTKRR